MLLAAGTGCNSIINGWLSPIELGSFTRETTLDIRGSLSIQDEPARIRGTTEPTPDDLVPTVAEYRAISGDVLNVFINELRFRGVESATQVTIDNQGEINLPVIGWVEVEGLTAREIEDKLRQILADRDILADADVLVQFAAQRGLTYTIFGNEALAIRINRGPGVFPIPRPDFRLIEAISVAGGLSELVTEVYVFREAMQDQLQAEALDMTREPARKSGSHGSPRTREEMAPSSRHPGLFSLAGAGQPSGPTLATYQNAPSQVPKAGEQIPQQPPQATTTPPADNDEPDEEGLSREVQEILELMEAGPGEPTPGAEADQPEPPPAQRLPEPPVRKPSRWIYDHTTGEWIEVESDEPADVPAPAPLPADEPMQPAVDWDLIAQEEQDIRVIQISAGGLREGDPRHNIIVRPDDIIRLYSGDIGFYYVIGHVRAPGAYTFRPGASVTLKNAIAAAGGLDALGWPDRVSVYRRVGSREQLLQVNLDRIFAGLEPDFYLKRDDIINVGTHPFAPFLQQIRNLTIPQLDSSMSFAYEWTRTETFFKTENFGASSGPGLFP